MLTPTFPAFLSTATNIEEIKKIGLGVAKKYGFPEGIVATSFTPDKFMFTVEVSALWHPLSLPSGSACSSQVLTDASPPSISPLQTTGALHPTDIVDFAFTALLNKLRYVMESCSLLRGSGGVTLQ
jgi:hypothetical protein